MRVWFACLVLSCCGLAACADDDSSGGPGCQMRTVAELPVLNDHGSPVIRATIDRKPVAFVVDTGARTSLIWEEAAERLGLSFDRSQLRMASGIGGTVSSSLVSVDALSLGSTAGHHMEFDSVPGGTERTVGGLPVVGLFGGDFLANYDVEFNLPEHLVTLFSEHHCGSNLHPWPQGGFYRLPFHLEGQTAITFNIVLDGHPTPVVLDSGAAGTIIDREAGRQGGATAATMAVDRISVARGIDLTALRSYRHRFDTLEIGPERFAPAFIEVADMNVSGLLGADYFRARKVWISYPHEMAYVQRVLFPPGAGQATGGGGGSASVAGVPKH